MPRQLAAGTSYAVDVITVTDGDTIDVRFPDGSKEELRMIGLDTPETKRNQRFERVQEWEGIDDPQTLVEWGGRASAFARDRLAGETVTISFDPSEPVRDQFDRLLVYLEYDVDGDRRFYNRELIAEGYARVYDSGVTNHDDFRAVERAARDANRGLWTASEPASTPPIRNRAVDALFVPEAASVRSDGSRLSPGRAPVRAAPTASQELRGDAVAYGDEAIPLVGVDRDARVALAGGLLIDERYEQAEGFDVDTGEFGQFPFLTNLCTLLSDRDGDVLIDGGHGQFGVDYALSSEDAAYYQRYLEGQEIAFEQRNRLSAAFLDGGRALVVTTPAGRVGDGEIERLRRFRNDGGAVILLGSASAPAFARANLNRLAADLGTDLRLNNDRVRDERHNLTGEATLPTTRRFDRSVPLFAGVGDGLVEVTLDVADVTADPAGDDGVELAAETVTLVNRGDEAVDASGWTLRDLADHAYRFPDGFELAGGATVTVHTGAGADDSDDLFWDAGRPVWNNRGDTVIVTDEHGVELLRVRY